MNKEQLREKFEHPLHGHFDINKDEDGGYVNVQTSNMFCAFLLGAKFARAEVLEESAKLCETKEIAFDIGVWADSTKKQLTAHTAIALASEIRALINKEQAQ